MMRTSSRWWPSVEAPEQNFSDHKRAQQAGAAPNRQKVHRVGKSRDRLYKPKGRGEMPRGLADSALLA